MPFNNFRLSLLVSVLSSSNYIILPELDLNSCASIVVASHLEPFRLWLLHNDKALSFLWQKFQILIISSKLYELSFYSSLTASSSSPSFSFSLLRGPLTNPSRSLIIQFTSIWLQIGDSWCPGIPAYNTSTEIQTHKHQTP